MIASDTYFWTIVALMAIGTISIRGSFIFLSSVIKITPRTKEIFSFIPAAILPAIVTPAVFFHEGQVSWLMDRERMVVLVLATGFWFITRSMFQTIVFGLFSLYAVTFWL